MFSTKLNLFKPFSRLVKKQKLETLDIVYNGQPFCNTVSKNQNTYNLDTTDNGQPFIGIPNNYIKKNMIGINHPDVENWLNTATLTGGSASSTTISALNTFCNSIDSAGLRSKFYRLNLFCGNNLQACLVPLYNSTSPNGLPNGYSIDINNNFISNDYNETGINGGLKGNGTNKYLNPGLDSIDITGNQSISCYVMVESTTANYYLLGGHAQANNNRTLGIVYYSGSYKLEDGHTGGEFNTGLTTKTVGFRAASSFGLSLRKMYLNGSAVFTSSATTVASTGMVSPFIFCRRDGTNPINFGDQRIGAYHIGVSMSDTDMINLYNAIQAFQTALNRNV